MKCYMVVELNVTDDSWVSAYVGNVTRLVEERGGRYLARTPKVEMLEGEGDPPQTVVVLEFPTKAVAKGFYESGEYAPYRKQRLAGSESRAFLVAAEDAFRPTG